MRPAPQPFFFAQQQQQQQHQLQLQQQAQQQAQQLQQLGTFHSPHYAQRPQQHGLHGLPVLGLPMGSGGGGGGMGPGMLLPQPGYQQWTHPQAWPSAGFPPSQQSLIQSALAQQHSPQQHQVAYGQDIRAPSGGPHLAHLHGVDRMRGNQQWAHPNDGNSRFGATRVQGDWDGMQQQQPELPSRNNRSGGGQSYGNGNAYGNAHDHHSRVSGNRHRGPGAPGRGSRFASGKNEVWRGGEQSRSPTRLLRCDACDRTFNNLQQSTAHHSTHVKCDVEGCSFEASGRVVKEHKQSKHEDSPSSMSVRSNRPVKSKESEEESVRWREERKRNYPTTENVKYKAEQTRAKRARGELMDDDARKRRERLKEILAKQAELGVPVAEVPAYYMSDHYGLFNANDVRGKSARTGPKDSRGRNTKRHLDRQAAPAEVEETETAPASVPQTSDEGLPQTKRENEMETGVEAQSVLETVETPVGVDTVAENGADQKMGGKKVCAFFLRGRCKKGNRCRYLHERRPKQKKFADGKLAPSRGPTLLAKLLETDVRREKSRLLQAFRFFVNNGFLLQYPETPLKFFEWEEGSDSETNVNLGSPDGEGQQVHVEDSPFNENEIEAGEVERDSLEAGEVERDEIEAGEVERDERVEATQ